MFVVVCLDATKGAERDSGLRSSPNGQPHEYQASGKAERAVSEAPNARY